MEQTTSPVNKRDVAFEHLRTTILEAPLELEYKIKLLDALSAYKQTL